MPQDLLTVWDSVQSTIKTHIGDIAFNTWFGPVKAKSAKPNVLTLEVPDSFFKDWLIQHYADLIQLECKRLVTDEITLDVVVNPTIIKQDQKNRLRDFVSRIQTDPQSDLKLNPKYTFENFIVGSSNRLTHAASFAVAEAPAKNYNPLFIYGGVGLGKTHLMHAICHYAKKNNPKINITYITSEKFCNELINAIQHRQTDSFRKKYRNVDILLVDDIHFIAGKESTQEEFFHTFNALYDNHKQIIISSDRPPKEIQKLEERLISRFSWGLITDVQPPNFETRIAILKKKMEKEKTKLPDDVLYFVAESIKNNIRELEGALIRLIAYALLENKEITLPLARDVLKDMLRETEKNITIEEIQKGVADFYNLQVAEIKAKRRNKNLVNARQVAMFLARKLTPLSLPEIGNFFGGKDHTTVLHAYNKINGQYEKDQQFKHSIERLIFEIKHQPN